MEHATASVLSKTTATHPGHQPYQVYEGLQRLEYVRTHTQSLSGRSLGGLDRAAALPGQRRRGRSGGSVQEELEEVVSVEAFSESVVALRTPSIPDWLCEGLLVSVG